MKQTIKSMITARHLEMREKAALLTGFSEVEMNRLIFDIAVEYMKGRGMCEEWLATWLREPMFWHWWRQQWTLVDELFWHRFESWLGKDSAKPKLRDHYIRLHSDIDYFPDAIVYEKIHSSYELAGQEILQKIRMQNNV